jgi:hypothetical protein
MSVVEVTSMAGAVTTINDLLDGHVGLDLECLDRTYLNGYVPTLQVGGQVVTFLTRHLGKPIPSPAVFEQIGDRFRRAVARFARDHDIPVVRFAKDDRKIDVMRPYQDRLAATGDCGVAAIGIAQEFQPVWTAAGGCHRRGPAGCLAGRADSTGGRGQLRRLRGPQGVADA